MTKRLARADVPIDEHGNGDLFAHSRRLQCELNAVLGGYPLGVRHIASLPEGQ